MVWKHPYLRRLRQEQESPTDGSVSIPAFHSTRGPCSHPGSNVILCQSGEPRDGVEAQGKKALLRIHECARMRSRIDPDAAPEWLQPEPKGPLPCCSTLCVPCVCMAGSKSRVHSGRLRYAYVLQVAACGRLEDEPETVYELTQEKKKEQDDDFRTGPVTTA